MNISNLTDQIEIAFWTGIVSLLNPRRFSRLVSISLIMLFGLATLLLTALTFANIGRATQLLKPQMAEVRMTRYLGRPDNGQNNLLLILVDQLEDSEPSLQGLWMLIKAPSGKQVTFMPIYPADSDIGHDVKQAFGLIKGSGLSPEFENVLQKQGLWWDNYLIIDREILATLVQLAGGIDLGEGSSNGQQVIDLLPIAEQDAQTALQLQARIAQGICQRFDSLLQYENPEEIFDLLIGGAPSQPVFSDLSHAELLASWNRLKKAGGLACEFPTLIGR
jgi:hypothetical protein